MISLAFHVRCRIIILHGDMLTRQLGTQYSDNDIVSADLLPTHTDQLVMTRKLVLSMLCTCLHILLLSFPLAFKRNLNILIEERISIISIQYMDNVQYYSTFIDLSVPAVVISMMRMTYDWKIIHGFCYHLVTSWTSCYLNTIYTLFSKLFLDSTTDMHQ